MQSSELRKFSAALTNPLEQDGSMNLVRGCRKHGVDVGVLETGSLIQPIEVEAVKVVNTLSVLNPAELLDWRTRLLQAINKSGATINEVKDSALWTLLVMVGTVTSMKSKDPFATSIRMPNEEYGWTRAVIQEVLRLMNEVPTISAQLEFAKQEKKTKPATKQTVVVDLKTELPEVEISPELPAASAITTAVIEE